MKMIIIPARAQSKRFPGKNSTEFLGLPLIVHSIKYAQAQIGVGEVVVSTDCPEIKKIALTSGAQVIDRPEHLATDLTPTVEVLQHALTIFDETIEWIVLLQPTNPLRPKDLFKSAQAAIQANGAKSLFTVSPNHKKIGHIDQGTFKPLNYTPGMRSQDMPPTFYENGLLYMTHVDLIRQGIIFDHTSVPLIVEHPFGQVDIDLPGDLALAKAIYDNQKNT
jgi:CMP-N-acetylneuraminic acid synthetase